MISKAAEFKKVLSGTYKDMYNVDFQLYIAMRRLGWKIFEGHAEDGLHKRIDYQTIQGDTYYTFEDGPHWNNDIIKSLKLLNRL